MNSEKLQEMFLLREKFMDAMRQSGRGYMVQWPLNMQEKKSQQMIREITLKGIEELFEALSELKNWKSHKLTENPDIDREAFLEEIVDALNYFFAVLILSGFSADDLYESYKKKDAVIHERLKNNY
jgi:hypothetical protein